MYRNSDKPGLFGASRRPVILIGIMLVLVSIHLSSHQTSSHPGGKSFSHGHRAHKQATVAGNPWTLPATRDEKPDPQSFSIPEANAWVEDPVQPAVPVPPKPRVRYTAEELIGKLSQWVNRDPEPIAPKDVERISRTLRQLAAKRGAAVSAILGFLGSGKDMDFEALRAGAQIGFQSLRLALFDLIRRAGESDPEIDTGRIFLETIRTTGSPLEVATLAGYLEAQAPGYYRQDILAAARNLFATASENGVNGRNVGPLFRVFQNYGGSETLAELERANPRWSGRYAAIALANLPEGKGIPSLIKTLQAFPSPATDPHASFALNTLAQVAANYPDAQAPIIEAIRANAIPNTDWPEFARAIAGLNRTQIEKPDAGIGVGVSQKWISFADGGTQLVYEIQNSAANLPPDQVTRRAEFIDKLVSETSNPVAIQALQQTRAALLGGIGPTAFR